MPPAVEKTCYQPSSSGNGARQRPLRIPLWVQIRLEALTRDFVGKITLNVSNGGIANFQVEPSGGDRITFHPKH